MKKIIALVCVLVLAGCTNNTEQIVSDGGGSGGVKLIVLSDGTKCAVIVGYAKGGIDCNWLS